MSDQEKSRWLVMKCVRPDSYYKSWEMLHGGHCETQEQAEALEAEWHKKYPKPMTMIIRTVGGPYSSVGNGDWNVPGARDRDAGHE